jgi:hypothetical protein
MTLAFGIVAFCRRSREPAEQPEGELAVDKGLYFGRLYALISLRPKPRTKKESLRQVLRASQMPGPVFRSRTFLAVEKQGLAALSVRWFTVESGESHR